MRARLLELAYRLRQHRLAGLGLDRWSVTLAWGAALVILLLWLLRERPSVLAWHWVFLAFLGLAGLAIFILRVWARQQSYVAFSPQAGVDAPAPEALLPLDKLPIQATGRFEVEGRCGFFAGLMAYWRTFASREHAVMAIAHESHFLGVARRPPEDVGMWYVFFRPEAIDAVTPGVLAFGSRSGPALRIGYRYSEPLPEGAKRRRPPRQYRTVLYLACEDDEVRKRIWADLLADGESLRIADIVPAGY
jgi:hypothetical protein